MINFRHNLDITADDFIDMFEEDEDFDIEAAAKEAAKKAAKKARRQARDEMRSLFDYDAIRAAAPASVPVVDAYDVYDETEDPDAVYATFVLGAIETAA